ncbi:MAG: family 20 glycosylhydrolase [Bacteroidota bacterium]
MNYYTIGAKIALLSLTLILACTSPPASVPMDMAEVSLIPHPVSLRATGSSFNLSKEASIKAEGEAAEIAELLAAYLRPATGFPLAISAGAAASGDIALAIDPALGTTQAEGYELTITEEIVSLKSRDKAGLFMGLQTLRQLLPASIEMTGPQSGPWRIATGEIKDYPEYAYRGAMLDVARHFFSVDEVKRFIDQIATYKLNTLHLHLSDDQGWRIEIKSWPKLTEVGSKTEVGGTEGGFYTQEEYTELVNYAMARQITVIPEVDMPGHTNAALVAYPELNCNPKDPNPEPHFGIEVGFSTLCTDKEIVYRFADDVIGELAAITPGPYIHVGGDETHATAPEDYIPFVERIQDIVHKHNKIMVGWDEIVTAKLAESSIPQFWASEENAQAAVAQNTKVIMSPAKRVYLDMQYDSTSKYGLHWAAYIEVDDSYNWEPTTYTDNIGRENILGIEAPLWSETVSNITEAEYMVFPRLPGIAEIAWSPASVRDWETYKVRLGKQKGRFEAMGINYYPSERVPWQ